MIKRKTSLTVRLKLPLKKKLKAIAESQRRTLENQTICLIENGVKVFEGRGKNGVNVAVRGVD